MGFPGVLPVANATAVEYGVKTALALGCTINKFQRFDRKNYFYPDLPKAYQISQFFFPVGENGKIAIDYLSSDRKTKKEFKVGINRVHLEEDAGKLIHTQDATLVDFNRCGTPLMEIVTEPDINSPEEAKAFMQELQRIVRSLGVSFADMEKGHMRVDANVSVRPKGTKELGTKIEVKNMNSFKFMEQALKHEIERQTKALEAGEKLRQETRGWDTKTNTTILQRVKEGSIDYRYFPEPDLPPIVLEDKQINNWSKEVTAELPSVLRARAEEVGLSYERINELQDKGELDSVLKVIDGNEGIDPVTVANYPGAQSDFYQWLMAEKPSNSTMRQVFDATKSGKSLAEAVGSIKTVGAADLEKVVKRVLDENPEVANRYQAGETKLFGFLTGQIMKQAGKGADPTSVSDLLNKLLTK
jgi:aspartyl-tRNA(Asn)/glutamyl-tRNA(Gln) amidotransferase subunit B